MCTAKLARSLQLVRQAQGPAAVLVHVFYLSFLVPLSIAFVGISVSYPKQNVSVGPKVPTANSWIHVIRFSYNILV